MTSLVLARSKFSAVFAILGLVALSLFSTPATAQVTAFMQSVASAASNDKALAAFYKANGYKPIWTGNSGRDRSRRQALLRAIQAADDHGLPAKSYDTQFLKANLRQVKSERDLGKVEVELSRLFLRYATDIQTGILTPRKVDSGLVRAVPYRDRAATLANFAKSTPAPYIRQLAPKTPEYTRLMKGKMTLEKTLARGGWGAKVPGKTLKPGATGASVVALRNRLIAMGIMKRSATQTYDASVQQAVQQFQLRHGLNPDGVVGAGTMREINVGPEKRLASVLVAMERERWNNQPLGKRHVWVNLTDFSAKIIDNDKVTFETRSVVGANKEDRRSPEFSDVMEHMVINPSWNVPRSITVKEYLPLMKKNANAAGHLKIIDSRGRTVPRSSINFGAYTEKTFPFAMKQPPSDGNALGLVKFIFPNKYNIYLHDTPAKSLFGRETRAFSHGCIRLHQPFEFAYALLAKQSKDPKGLFHAHLKTGSESVVPLDNPVPVHIDYRTAMGLPKGGLEYRRDVYGRDARIFSALQKAGVVLRAVDS